MAEFETLLELLAVEPVAARFGIGRRLIHEELDRYKIWAGNIGATLGAQSMGSLEHRLKDATHVSNFVIRCLGDLKEALTGSMSKLFPALGIL